MTKPPLSRLSPNLFVLQHEPSFCPNVITHVQQNPHLQRASCCAGIDTFSFQTKTCPNKICSLFPLVVEMIVWHLPLMNTAKMLAHERRELKYEIERTGAKARCFPSGPTGHGRARVASGTLCETYWTT